MEERGLHEAEGWQISERIRSCAGGTEVVMTPLHLRYPTPPDLECVVEIYRNEFIDSHCTQDH